MGNQTATDIGADGRIPVPDPTLLTTQQLERQIAALRLYIDTKLGDGPVGQSLRGIIEARLDGMDTALQLLQSAADRFPARIDEKIAALEKVHEEKFDALLDLMNEKFASVQKQFAERDVRTEQAAGAVKIAVDAALQAQKEAASEQSKSNAAATTKSEASTTKLIDAQATLITNMTKAFDDKIGDVKDRVNRIEGMGAGAGALWGYIAGAIGVLIGLSRFIKP